MLENDWKKLNALKVNHDGSDFRILAEFQAFSSVVQGVESADSVCILKTQGLLLTGVVTSMVDHFG